MMQGCCNGTPVIICLNVRSPASKSGKSLPSSFPNHWKPLGLEPITYSCFVLTAQEADTETSQPYLRQFTPRGYFSKSPHTAALSAVVCKFSYA